MEIDDQQPEPQRQLPLFRSSSLYPQNGRTIWVSSLLVRIDSDDLASLLFLSGKHRKCTSKTRPLTHGTVVMLWETQMESEGGLQRKPALHYVC